VRINVREVMAGLMFLAFAVAFGLGSFSYAMGAALNMGPAYFPRIVAVILGALGLAIMFGGLRGGAGSIAGVSIRAVVLLLAAPVVFAVSVRPLGLIPAMAFATAMSAGANRDASILDIVMITVSLTFFGCVLFVWGLGVSTPLFAEGLGL
jgi:putative tricarboxylic transport membrane protein